MDLDHSSIRFLEIRNQFEQIARMRIPFLAQHSHEAFRRTSKSLTETRKANCPIDVLAQDHLCRIQIPGQHIVDGFAGERR